MAGDDHGHNGHEDHIGSREDIRLVNAAPLHSSNPHTALNITDTHNQESKYSEKALTQAKDRAQGVTTAALTITQVVLLKTVLDAGPDGHRYFVLSLVLICVSLALEVVAGFLLIQISQMHKYFRNFGDSCWNDICCYRRVDNNSRKERNKVLFCQVLDVNEKKALERYDDWRERIVAHEQNNDRAQFDVPIFKQKIEDLENGIANIIKDEPVDQKRKAELQTELEEVKSKRKKALEHMHEFQVQQYFGEKLAQEVDVIEEKRVNKRIAMLLNALNVILYIVCTINAFITAFGVVQPMIENVIAGNNEVVTKSPSEGVTMSS